MHIYELMYVCVCMNVCKFKCVYMRRHIIVLYACVCLYVCLCEYIVGLCIYVCRCVWAYFVYMCVCMDIRISVFVCKCIISTNLYNAFRSAYM